MHPRKCLASLGQTSHTFHRVSDDSIEQAAALRGMRQRLGWSQLTVANAVGVSLSTVKRLEQRGAGHNLRRVRAALEQALTVETKPSGAPAPRDVIDSLVASSGEPPSIMVREFLAFLETLSVEQQWTAVRAFAVTVSALARARGEAADDDEQKND